MAIEFSYTRPRRQRESFTLIEFIFLIAVCTVLLVVLIAALARGREEARKRACKEPNPEKLEAADEIMQIDLILMEA